MSPRSNPPARRHGARRGPVGQGRRPTKGSGGRTGTRTDWRLAGGVVVVALALLFGIFALGGGLNAVAPVPTLGPSASGLTANCPTAQPAALAAGQTRTVTIQTKLGSIVIKIDGSISPIAAGNFVALAECGFYDGQTFWRTASQQDGSPFVIQGGDPIGDGTGGPGYTIQDEPVTATFKRGTVAMARTQQPNSEGSQFFIVLSDSAGPVLQSANPGYAILGSVTTGMDVADGIFQASGGQEAPPNAVAMSSVTVTNP